MSNLSLKYIILLSNYKLNLLNMLLYFRQYKYSYIVLLRYE